MTVRDLKERYDYGYWANQKLFKVLETLTPEEFTQSVAGSYGSIRNTLVHVLSAEAGWLERCGGPERRQGTSRPAMRLLVHRYRRSCTSAWCPLSS